MSSLLESPAATATESLILENVSQILPGKDGVSVQELCGAGFAYRHDWGDRNGQHILQLNDPAFTRNSKVFVSIGEGAPGGGKFVGLARYTLHNVASHDGWVKIWVNIEWGSPIRLYADYFVIND